jgi:hypothetical protein
MKIIDRLKAWIKRLGEYPIVSLDFEPTEEELEKFRSKLKRL